MAFKDLINNLKQTTIRAPNFNKPMGGGIKISAPTPLKNYDSLAKALNSKLVTRK